jgi:DNA topoisomerase I
VEADLRQDGLTRERVLAATVRLLERTLIRVGNDEYARENRSYGIATLRDRHARIDGFEVLLRFRGKAGRMHEITFRDRRLAGIVRRCRDLPGQELFQWLDSDGTVRDVRSDDINAYIREAAGSDEFSAKDFRTWAGTVLAFRALAATGQAAGVAEVPGTGPGDGAGSRDSGGRGGSSRGDATPRAIRRSVKAAIAATADRLGNTPAVARQAYVHPGVIDAYLDDGVRDAILEAADVNPALPLPPSPAEEEAVLDLLAAQARREREHRARRRPAPAGR